MKKLSNRDFSCLFFGQIVSQMGDTMYLIGLMWLVLEYTPVGSGNILWTATIGDANPDDDVKTATTKIVQ